ncbi:WD40 repeat domain-containing protein [Microcoleus sp. herbarium5]
MQIFKEHQADVWSMSFSCDRTTLASAQKNFVGEALEPRCG